MRSGLGIQFLSVSLTNTRRYSSIITRNWTTANFRYRRSLQSICTPPSPPPHSLHLTHGDIYTFMIPRPVEPLLPYLRLNPGPCPGRSVSSVPAQAQPRPSTGLERKQRLSRTNAQRTRGLSADLQPDWWRWRDRRGGGDKSWASCAKTSEAAAINEGTEDQLRRSSHREGGWNMHGGGGDRGRCFFFTHKGA